MILYLDDELAELWKGQDVFQLLTDMHGEVYRDVKGRRTLRFVLAGKGYFLKLHHGVGWKEIFKNLLKLRLPVVSAANEWCAVDRLTELGIDTMTTVAYGKRGWNPARLESFIVTRELENTIDLEAYCAEWTEKPPEFSLKKALIEKVADISRRMHQAGICHRDYYLCHFHLLSGSEREPAGSRPRIFLIDLHRALFGKKPDSRWVKKDIAGLYFSSMEIGLTQRDRLRFMRCYANTDLRVSLEQDRRFWNSVLARGQSLYEKLGNPQRTGQ